MIELPDIDKAFEYENNFYFSCEVTRIAKWAVHYELFKGILDLPGVFVECGVFKGVSFLRFAMFRQLLGHEGALKMLGFDVFGEFPESTFSEDQPYIEKFVSEAGSESISEDQLYELLQQRGMEKNVELIKGDICKTIPKYHERDPSLRISLSLIQISEPTRPY